MWDSFFYLRWIKFLWKVWWTDFRYVHRSYKWILSIVPFWIAHVNFRRPSWLDLRTERSFTLSYYFVVNHLKLWQKRNRWGRCTFSLEEPIYLPRVASSLYPHKFWVTSIHDFNSLDTFLNIFLPSASLVNIKRGIGFNFRENMLVIVCYFFNACKVLKLTNSCIVALR